MRVYERHFTFMKGCQLRKTLGTYDLEPSILGDTERKPLLTQLSVNIWMRRSTRKTWKTGWKRNSHKRKRTVWFTAQ